MASNRVSNTAAAVALTLATEVAVVTVTPAAPSNQVAAPLPGVLIEGEIIITGAVSATNCTLKLRRGAGLTGTDIFPTDPVLSVDAAATDRSARFSVVETVANFNGANGIYTLSATQAGAATTARIATLSVQPLAAGV